MQNGAGSVAAARDIHYGHVDVAEIVDIIDEDLWKIPHDNDRRCSRVDRDAGVVNRHRDDRGAARDGSAARQSPALTKGLLVPAWI